MPTQKLDNWPHFWFDGIAIAIASIQIPLSFAIDGLSAGILLLQLERFHDLSDSDATTFELDKSTIVAFVLATVLLVTWISAFCGACRNRLSFGCSTHAFVLSCILVSYDDENMKLLSRLTSSWWIPNRLNYETELNLVRGRLAVGAISIACSLIYMGIYIYALIRTLLSDENVTHIVPEPIQQLGPDRRSTSVYPCPTMIYPALNRNMNLKPASCVHGPNCNRCHPSSHR